jgi:hypothetical protein
MMPGLFSPDIPPALDVVGPDSAVCFQELSVSELTWVILENTRQPNGDFEEVPLDSPLAKALVGKRPGDTAVIAKGRMQDRTATVVQIVPKEVRRYQDLMMGMQMRFGAESPVESIRFGVPGDESAEKGLAILKEWVKQHAYTVIQTGDLYRTMPVSLHLFGWRLGVNAYLAISGLAQDPTQQVKCSLGTADEHAQAILSLQTSKAIVVDITALATLRLLGLTKILSTNKYKFIVSQHTRITLHEMLARARISSAPGATFSHEDGETRMVPKVALEEEHHHQDDAEFVRFVENHTEYRSGVALAALPPDRRELVEKAFGQYGAESIAIAADPDLVLWTDDLIQAQFSATEFGGRRVWTQVVLFSLAEAGLISSDEYAEASARMIGMDYAATFFDASILLAGFRLAEWAAHRYPAKQFVKIFASPGGGLQQLIQILVSFAEKLYRETILPVTRCAIVRTLMDAIATHPHSIVLLKSFRQMSPRVFGVNALGQQQFADCFDRWLEQRENPLILPG